MKTLIRACLLGLVLIMHGAFAPRPPTAKGQGWGRGAGKG